jgi:hypothetical protein
MLSLDTSTCANRSLGREHENASPRKPGALYSWTTVLAVAQAQIRLALVVA